VGFVDEFYAMGGDIMLFGRRLASLSIVAVMGIAGCSKLIETSPKNSDDAVEVPLSFTISSSYFNSSTKESLYRRLADGQVVSFSGLTDATIEAHHKNWVDRHSDAKNPSLERTLKDLHRFSSPFESQTPEEIKETIESRVSEFAGQPLVYNANAISLLDGPYGKRTQAYSGTLLFLVTLRNALGKAASDAANLVVIFESGHLLPGYLTQENGEWLLTGIETAVSGKGKIEYGPVNQALKERMLRIVSADLFLWVDLFKFEVDDLVGMANSALRLTSEKYAFSDTAYLAPERFKREANSSKLAWTPFSFGSADVSATDRERAKLDVEKRSALPQLNPNITIQHAIKLPPPPVSAPAPTPQSTTETNPTYPYREIASADAPDGKVFQCWDFIDQKWVDMPHRKEGDVYYIKTNPCEHPPQPYELLPLPLKLEIPEMAPPLTSPYGASPYGGEEWEYDE
jgi:hypothetical protein